MAVTRGRPLLLCTGYQRWRRPFHPLMSTVALPLECPGSNRPRAARRQRPRVLAAWLIVAFLGAHPTLLFAAGTADDAARYLAGLPPAENSPYRSLTDDHWRAYQRGFDSAWQDLEHNRFQPMRAWQAQILASEIDPALPLYYPFGGPDMIHALMLYPRSHHYLLFGLEPPGAFLLDPETPAAERHQLLDAVQWALRDIYQRSYFITGRMSSDLNRPQLDGVLPLLLVFIARAGYEVVSIEQGRLTADGEFSLKAQDAMGQEGRGDEESPSREQGRKRAQAPNPTLAPEPSAARETPAQDKAPPSDASGSAEPSLRDANKTATGSCPEIRGVRVRFRAHGDPGYAAGAADAMTRQATYFQIDVSDSGLRDCAALDLYLKRLAPTNTFVKSASYLMHYGTFNRIRALTLQVSASIFQDDTGVPYRDLDPADWDILLFGRYTQPIKDFSGVFQPDLNQAYLTKAHRVAELPFEMGYHWWTSAQNHLLALKRAEPTGTHNEDARDALTDNIPQTQP